MLSIIDKSSLKLSDNEEGDLMWLRALNLSCVLVLILNFISSTYLLVQIESTLQVSILVGLIYAVITSNLYKLFIETGLSVHKLSRIREVDIKSPKPEPMSPSSNLILTLLKLIMIIGFSLLASKAFQIFTFQDELKELFTLLAEIGVSETQTKYDAFFLPPYPIIMSIQLLSQATGLCSLFVDLSFIALYSAPIIAVHYSKQIIDSSYLKSQMEHEDLMIIKNHRAFTKGIVEIKRQVMKIDSK
jgi:hypothetical protein